MFIEDRLDENDPDLARVLDVQDTLSRLAAS
jgi:hypothetical protein